MKERPILFSGPMVRAILEGRKTMTRRVVKSQPECQPILCDNVVNKGRPTWVSVTHLGSLFQLCPYGQPGDRLWVRETWGCSVIGNEWKCVKYKASMNDSAKYSRIIEEPGWGKESHPIHNVCKDWYRLWVYHSDHWRPSIHMPRWASRILLEIVSVRVERLQDISVDDAKAEGMTGTHMLGDFRELWDSISSKRGYGWDFNPWVWVVEFKRVEP